MRDALVLPFLFLTIFLLAGARVGASIALVPPSVFSLVLGTMLVATLVRSGALSPDALLHGSRSVVANANGAVVLATLFGAAAQVLGMLTPRSGLPLFFVDVFLFVLLLNTLVAQPDRTRLLRSLAVIFGSTLVLKHVLLAGLSDPSGGQTRRVLVALFDAATFGTIAQEPQSAGAGYLAFLSAGLFLAGVAALPRTVAVSSSTKLTHIR
ncbi:MAG: hypothetical protein ABIQ52_14915 [Vicinamibacterales bacterium]